MNVFAAVVLADRWTCNSTSVSVSQRWTPVVLASDANTVLAPDCSEQHNQPRNSPVPVLTEVSSGTYTALTRRCFRRLDGHAVDLGWRLHGQLWGLESRERLEGA